MGKFIDLTGQRFGRLTVIERDTSRPKNDGAFWLCKCDCGNVTSVRGKELRRGNTKSCGCLALEKLAAHNKTHGLSGTKIYRKWQSMRKRCYKPNDTHYKNYGGRGIKVCEEWRKDFKAFYDYVSQLEHFGEEGYSLDRIDNSRGYEVGNVRWATAVEQANNKTNNHFVDIGNGKQMTLTQIMQMTGAAFGTIQDRVRNNWQAEDLLQPPQSKHERAPHFDVGNGELLTAAEIADKTGLALSTVYRRIHRGLTGAALLAPAKK